MCVQESSICVCVDDFAEAKHVKCAQKTLPLPELRSQSELDSGASRTAVISKLFRGLDWYRQDNL